MARWRGEGCPAQPGIRWRREQWLAAFPEHAATFAALPEELDRAAVELAVNPLPETEPGAVSAFFVVMAWGFAETNYGPYRVSRMLSSTGPTAPARLLQATHAVRRDGPSAAYRTLASAARIKYLGPAFGTKFLFFQSAGHPRALILDGVVSRWLVANCDVRLNATRWSLATYERYLALMRTWANVCELAPETLEMILFGEQAAAEGSQWAPRNRGGSVLTRTGDPAEFDDDAPAGIAGDAGDAGI